MRTDRPEAELYLIDNGKIVAEQKWLAHRELADTLLTRIELLLASKGVKLAHLKGIIVFTGAGSFTGLRIGTTVANALAYSNSIPIVTTTGSGWVEKGLKNIKNSKPGELVAPQYSSEPNITKPAYQPGRPKKL